MDRFGDRAKAGSSADADTVLSKLFSMEILSLPSERRTKDAVRAALNTNASTRGIKPTLVRDFVNSRMEFEGSSGSQLRLDAFRTAMGSRPLAGRFQPA